LKDKCNTQSNGPTLIIWIKESFGKVNCYKLSLMHRVVISFYRVKQTVKLYLGSFFSHSVDGKTCNGKSFSITRLANDRYVLMLSC